jgi:hypothetical protein
MGITTSRETKNLLGQKEHRAALIRRRIRFVVGYPPIGRLFRKGMRDHVERALLERLRPDVFRRMKTRADYERWLERTVESRCWSHVSRWKCGTVRWGHFAKVLNILVYEILANNELTQTKDWRRLRLWLHLPIDSIVQAHCKKLAPAFKVRKILKGMTRDEYCDMQLQIRKIANEKGVPPIWFEAAWSAQ